MSSFVAFPGFFCRELYARRKPVARGTAGCGLAINVLVVLGKRGVVLGTVSGASEAVDWPL